MREDIRWPSEMTPESFSYFKEWLELSIRKINRSIKQLEASLIELDNQTV